MAYRLADPNPVFFDTTGLELCSNGTLTFYDKGTATPKATYSNEALSTVNPNPVSINSAGRAAVQIWLGGDYTVVLKDQLGATVWSRDVIDVTSAGTTIPALVSGQFLSNDGINLDWEVVRQVPDPTGSANKVLGTDGSNLIWVNQTAIPDPDITNTSTSTIIGDGTTKVRFLRGTATGINAGGRTQTVSVTFASAFTDTPFVTVQLTNAASPAVDSANQPSGRVTSVTTTGFTVVWTMGELDDSQSKYNFGAAVTFSYLAVGAVA